MNSWVTGLAAGVAAFLTLAEGASAQTATGVGEAIADGKLLLEVRGRYETVDQTRTAVLKDEASAYTIRTRLGWESGAWRGLKGLVELEDVRHLGPGRFAVNAPGAAGAPLNGAGKVRYPLINDPDGTELNRLQVAWSPNAAFSGVVGRQRIALDDQRFVGALGWRQDEQTFDGVRLDLSRGAFKVIYAYVVQVNRVLGEKRDWHSDSHLAQATWSASDALRVQGFVYALDFDNARANSSVTRGLKLSGKAKAGAYQAAYSATYARQGDYHGDTPDYGLDYWAADLAASVDIYTARVGYESLEGNGVRGFTTPLGTTHAFQGWADAFVQPLGGAKGFVDGLEDRNVSLTARPPWRWGGLSKVDLMVRYHDFDDQRTGANLGREFDAQAQAALTPKVTAAIKYADFRRVARVPAGTATPPASRTKVWFTLEFKL